MLVRKENTSAQPNKYDYVKVQLEWGDLSYEARRELNYKIQSLFPNQKPYFYFPVSTVDLCIFKNMEELKNDCKCN